ncbi:MAG: OmpA family protein [Mariprofundus sp.]
MKKSNIILIAFLLMLSSCSFIDKVFGPAGQQATPKPPVQIQLDSQNNQLNSEITTLNGELERTNRDIAAEEESARLRAEQSRQAAEAAQAAIPTDRLWVSVSFASGKNSLTRGSKQALKKLAAKFLSHNTGQQRLDIRGYTDDEPVGGYPGHRHASRHPYASNIELSKARADTVARVLIDAGISRDDVHSEGLGATNFIADNSTESERKRNRRVEIHLLQ